MPFFCLFVVVCCAWTFNWQGQKFDRACRTPPPNGHVRGVLLRNKQTKQHTKRQNERMKGGYMLEREMNEWDGVDDPS